MTSPEFLVGTASWTDPSLVKSDLFYPPHVTTAEARLNFYAAHFNTVEVDSTFYALPAERNARLWAKRTPERFVFNIKAFALLTQHAAEVNRLPKAVKEIMSSAERNSLHLSRPSTEVLELAFGMFWSALAPLKEAEKLGKLLFQFPPYFTCQGRNQDYLASLAERMPGADIAIEFRHPSWLDAQHRTGTMSFLRAHQLSFVSVDAPRHASVVPSFLEITGPDAYVRFHGRNQENWFKRNITVAERFKYLYSERELAEWAGRLKEMSGVRRAFAIFNNCYGNFGIMNATTMKQMLSH
ncbi:MAG: DUF72 domain-containing protein [Candidatus Binataceae bacterium]